MYKRQVESLPSKSETHSLDGLRALQENLADGFWGNGMRLAHLADLDDGLLDVCFVRNLSKLRLLRLFHVVFNGRHIGMKEVEYWKASRVRIQTEPVMDLYADGEYVCSTPVELAVKREALHVIVPG